MAILLNYISLHQIKVCYTERQIFICLSHVFVCLIQQISSELVFGWVDKIPQNIFILINSVFCVVYLREYQSNLLVYSF